MRLCQCWRNKDSLESIVGFSRMFFGVKKKKRALIEVILDFECTL